MWRALVLCSFLYGRAHAQAALLTATANPQAPAPTPTTPPDQDDETLPLCQTDLRLSGTVYDDDHPERSFAMLQGNGNAPGAVYREGMRIGPFELVAIEPRGVMLRDTNGDCWLRMTGAQPGSRGPVLHRHHHARHHARPNAAAFTPRELDEGIRRLGPEAFEVQRTLLGQAVARAAALARTTQLVQVHHYSDIAGLRLQKIAPDGLFARLGLEAGDMVKTLNGLPLTGLDGVLRAQTLVGGSSRLNLLLMRRGQPITIDYNLVP